MKLPPPPSHSSFSFHAGGEHSMFAPPSPPPRPDRLFHNQQIVRSAQPPARSVDWNQTSSRFFGLKEHSTHGLLGELSQLLHSKRHAKTKTKLQDKLDRTTTGTLSPHAALFDDLRFEVRPPPWQRDSFPPRKPPRPSLPSPTTASRVAEVLPIALRRLEEPDEAVFAISKEGRVRALALPPESSKGAVPRDATSLLASTLRRCVRDKERREVLVQGITQQQPGGKRLRLGGAHKRLAEESKNLHSSLLSKVDTLQRVRGELQMNFELVAKTARTGGLEGVEAQLQERLGRLLELSEDEQEEWLGPPAHIEDELLELSKALRSALRHVDADAQLLLELVWKATVYLFEAMLGQQQALVRRATAEAERELESRRAEVEASLAEQQASMEAKLEEAAQTIVSLRVSVGRLAEDKERAAQQVWERDLEIRRLSAKRQSQPHQLTAFLEELETSLEKTVQERQVQLKAIGFMADVCTVQTGAGRLDPVWQKKRAQLRKQGLAVRRA